MVATLVAIILGTLAAFALGRHRFRGQATTNVLMFLPMATPEVVAGSSLLTLFLNIGIPLGHPTIIIAHIMFCMSFVVVTVKARLAGMDPPLEQAAHDLYANPRQTFWRITLPLVMPGIVRRGAAGVLAVVRRLHHHELQLGLRGHLPDVRLGCRATGLPPQINVIGTA